MKLKSAALAAALSLMPLGQPLLIGTGALLTSSAVILSVPKKAKAESAFYYFRRGFDKGNTGDWSGAISDFTKALDMDLPREARATAYFARAGAKKRTGDMNGACSDLRKASSLGKEGINQYLKEEC